MATSRDVARAAGVSQTTVSRVLNGSDRVRPETRQKVLDALQGYSPNASARAMRTRRTQTIGIVASQITNPYFPELVEALYAAARRRNLDVLLWSDPASTPDAVVVEGVRRGLVDGVCLATAVSSESVRVLADGRVPVVLVNRGLRPQLTDQVLSNSDQIGQIAADYLLRSGRLEIGVVFGPPEIGASNDRLESFLAALDRIGVTVREDWIVRGPLEFETGYEAVPRIYSGRRGPRAIFCGNDLVAFGVRSALQKRKIRVPRDVWLVGIDDLPMAAWEVFDLTSIRQPIEQMAERAIGLLCERIDAPGLPLREELLDVELVARGSTERTDVRA